ncbi:MAG: cbb3-type cytochrome oxidase assembly protein CcoS [Calditrichia bacterium]
MSAIVVLIGFSLIVAIGFLIAFLWAVKSGQFDDKYTPSIRMLMDDSESKENEQNQPKTN